MVYIPWNVFCRRYTIKVKQKHRALKPGELFAEWVKMLDYYPTKSLEWNELKREWGDALKYHWTIWTPFGRKKEPLVVKRWFMDETW